VTGAIVQAADVQGRAFVEDSADVVIIGSGAGGATAARVLTEAGLDVILIEEGPHVPAAALRGDVFTAFRRMWRDMGFQVASGRAITPILQGACVGGTTAINGAIVHRAPDAILDAWRAEHGAGELLRARELERVYDALDRELSVAPAPEAVFGRQNALMEQAAARLHWRGNRIRRNVADCDGSAHCNQGCPNARKQSMDNTYVPRALARGARLYATCTARELIAEGGRAAGVIAEFRDRERGLRGPRLRVHARSAVVLAASAIQSPLFLLANGIGGGGLVGRRLQAHPGTAVAGAFDELVEPWFGATQGFESTHFWHERMKFETVGMPLELAAVRLPGFGARLARQLADFGKVAFFGVQIRARAHGRVRRSLRGRKAIAFDLTDEDVRTLKLGVHRLCELMLAAGARSVSPGVHGLPERITSLEEAARIHDLPDDPRLFHCIASHLFGTAVMAPSAQGGVVGPDCQVHGVPGLYVTDSSVFPSNLGVNPQHTICALSWLASERIAERALGQRHRAGASAARSRSAGPPAGPRTTRGERTMTTLQEMLNSERTGIDEIGAWLDAATPDVRLAAAFSLGRAEQRALFKRAAQSTAAFTLEHFVPAALPPLAPVHHAGKNTLPLPGKHKFFEKRFCRPGDGSARLFGYNQAPSRKLVGPGYFVARFTQDEPAWRERGPIVVDYFQVPDGPVASGWPAVVPNSHGLQRFVYNGTRDFMRRVSAHVSIGAAYKGEKALDHYFVLVRQDG
jgi:choline dehydrogenase-like flavoprotein